MLLGGLAVLGLLKWLRNGFRGWARDEMNFTAVGYVLPLGGISLVLMGIGGFRTGLQHLPPDPLETALTVIFMAGVVFMFIAAVATLEVPMPPILLPRWARDKSAREIIEPDFDNPKLLLTDRARSVDLTVPGFSDDWLTTPTNPEGTLVAAIAGQALPSGYHPAVTVTRYDLGSLDLATWTATGPDTTAAQQTPVTFAGRPAVHTTTRHTTDDRDLTTWTWATTDAGEGLRLAVTCATADAADYADTATAIAASLSWKDGNDPITGRPRRRH